MSGPVNTLSSMHANILSRRHVADLQSALSRAGKEASTGLKDDVYRELGRGSVRAISMRREQERTEAFLGSNQQLSGKLDSMALSLSSAREGVQEVLDLVAPNIDSSEATSTQLQSAARSALATLTARLNTSYGGVQLFSGVASQTPTLAAWDEAGATPSPKQMIEGLIGGGLGDAADAQAKVDELRNIFDSTAGGGLTYEGVIYMGAPDDEEARLSARIDEGVTLDYDVQASDEAFAKVYQGLAMLAATDVSQIDDPEAYSAYMSEVKDVLSEGVSGMLRSEGTLGRAQERLSKTMTAQQDRSDLLSSRVLDLEGVDSYEAATRVSTLKSQLEATYAITSQLSKLSFLNYMR